MPLREGQGQGAAHGETDRDNPAAASLQGVQSLFGAAQPVLETAAGEGLGVALVAGQHRRLDDIPCRAQGCGQKAHLEGPSGVAVQQEAARSRNVHAVLHGGEGFGIRQEMRYLEKEKKA